MDKQRMSNILSSVQMSPRDRKDFIEELSKLGKGEDSENNQENDDILSYTLKISPRYKMIIQLLGYYGDANNEGIDFNKEEEKVKLYIDVLNECKTIEPIIVTAKRIKSTYGNSNNKYYLDIDIEPTELKAVFYNDNNAEGVINVGIKSGLYTDILGHGYKLTTYEIIKYPKYNKQYPIFTTKDNNQNKQILESINITQCYLFNSDNKLYTAFYDNGTITAFVENKLKQYDVNFETGAITESISINPELIGTVAKLEVGDADDICQRNLELINMAITQAGANHFDVDIDYGVGSATFTQGLADDAIAGTATIIVATGYVTKYNLYGNGKVEKVGNDIDLFALEARIAALEGA